MSKKETALSIFHDLQPSRSSFTIATNMAFMLVYFDSVSEQVGGHMM